MVSLMLFLKADSAHANQFVDPSDLTPPQALKTRLEPLLFRKGRRDVAHRLAFPFVRKSYRKQRSNFRPK